MISIRRSHDAAIKETGINITSNDRSEYDVELCDGRVKVGLFNEKDTGRYEVTDISHSSKCKARSDFINEANGTTKDTLSIDTIEKCIQNKSICYLQLY